MNNEFIIDFFRDEQRAERNAVVQYLKDDVQERISEAALVVFARDGYQGATMAAIAKAARISTGNIYRYYETKDVLFYDIVDAAFVEQFNRLLRRRVTSAKGQSDVTRLAKGAPYWLASEDLFRFAFENRLRLVILFSRAKGSRYENFAGDTARDLARRAIRHFRELGKEIEETPAIRFNLLRIYEAMLSTTAAALAQFTSEGELREAVGSFSNYHLAGLKGFFS